MEVIVNNIKNAVLFPQLDIIPLITKDNDLFMIIGSDKDNTGKYFHKLVEGRVHSIDYRGLKIDTQNAILTGYDFSKTGFVGEKLNNLVYGEKLWMPTNYDDDTRCAYKYGTNDCIKYTEPHVADYMKYCISRLGNPKYHLLFKITKHVYKASKFYEDVIKPKFNN